MFVFFKLYCFIFIFQRKKERKEGSESQGISFSLIVSIVTWSLWETTKKGAEAGRFFPSRHLDVNIKGVFLEVSEQTKTMFMNLFIKMRQSLTFASSEL